MNLFLVWTWCKITFFKIFMHSYAKLILHFFLSRRIWNFLCTSFIAWKKPGKVKFSGNLPTFDKVNLCYIKETKGEFKC